jgi:hypothetical protein
MSYQFTFYYPECGEKPIFTIVGKRLVLNKETFQIGDTIKGKFYLKVISNFPSDSIKNDKIYFFDSCMFNYKIEKNDK